MPFRKTLLPLLLMGVLSAPTLAKGTPPAPPTAMATVLASVTTATPVQLVTVGFSKETTATLARLQAAMKEHPVETLDLTLNTPEGQPFPYREWFGISREAYAQVRAAKPDLFPSGTSTLTVHKRGTGGSLLVLQGGDGLEALNGLQVNLKANTIRTPWGTTEIGKPVSVNDKDGMSPRTGTTWEIDQGDLTTGNITGVTFTLMRLARDGRILVNYKVGIMRDYEVTQKTDLTFLLPPGNGPLKDAG
ncbi:hypothetical protein [Deinococcus aetherius]|uniref:hypothetical protein n=1 Tax=Deinococcus aetherius TaxID=200252 RepID=UPI00223043F1|nr:hypothetical protein [Deinococcus aetherius]